MLLLGLLLLAATGAFIGVLIADNLAGGPDYTVAVFGNRITTMNSLAIFLAGIALTLILGLALAMITAGMARGRRRRTVVREARTATAARGPADEAPAAAGGTATKPPKRHHFRFGH
ncbi:hypothetical protein [Streptomyces lunalinharesii]|uniref:Integral membrane protein n=1 Tax=Streptomyces lunalinharesii TaxID=333384 RepID=A0ABP6EL33_9ACTN